MAGSCCTPPRSEYRRFFNRKFAAHDAEHYRRRGLSRSAAGLVRLAGEVDDESVLDVGGGIGMISLELLEHGAASATVVELSDAYDGAAAELLTERGLTERVARRLGDFAAGELPDLEPHDIVVLHRVVCCHPDVEAMIGRAAGATGRRLLLTYPRKRLLTRLGFRAINTWLCVRSCGFRAYVHPVERIVAAAEAGGLRLEERRTEGVVWENAAFVRAG